jgi:hypothetical protein
MFARPLPRKRPAESLLEDLDGPGMETSLHRQLKALYCGPAASRDLLIPDATQPRKSSKAATARRDGQEVRVDGFRIDAVHRGRLIEIQQGSLAALRHKVRALLCKHRVTVVKPLVARKLIVRHCRVAGPVVSTRRSPRHETSADLFTDLVHFVDVFPHPRLILEVVFTAQEEHRVPARRRRFRSPDFRVTDRLLVGIEGRLVLKDENDLLRLLPSGLEETFTTGEIACLGKLPRWQAQKMAYCLRKCGALETVGKRGGAWLYRIAESANRSSAEQLSAAS